MEEENGFQYFTNSTYKEDRIDRKTLIIKINNTDAIPADPPNPEVPAKTPLSGTVNEIEILLEEPLNIDKLSDIYLDSFVTLNAKSNITVDNTGFLISIKEFNINTGTNISSGGNKIYIPNEQSDKPANSATNFHKVHKGKKLNYICQINPTKLKKLTFKISNMVGEPAFDAKNTPAGAPNPAMILELVIVSRK